MDVVLVGAYFFVIAGLATWSVATRRLEVGAAAFFWFIGVAIAAYLLDGVVIQGGEAVSRGFEGVASNFGEPGLVTTIVGGVTGILIARD